MVSLHRPDHTSVMNIIKHIGIRQCLCRSIGSVVWFVKTNYLTACYTLMGFSPTQRCPTLVNREGGVSGNMECTVCYVTQLHCTTLTHNYVYI